MMGNSLVVMLSHVTVHLLTDPDDIFRWNAYIERDHYLHSSRMVGEQLRYAIKCNGMWVGCCGWSAAFLRSRLRTEWTGWSSIQEQQRLHLVVQNARFLLLPEKTFMNLASRSMGLMVKRLSADWEERYGHPVYLAETCVDVERSGACYAASNWQELGKTRGFRRVTDGYKRHNIVKKYYVYPIKKHAQRLLSSATLSDDRPVQRMNVSQMPLENDPNCPNIMSVLRCYFSEKIQQKKQKGGYAHATILGLLLAGFTCGCPDTENIAAWARTLTEKQKILFGCPYRKIRNGSGYGIVTPSANTFRYALEDRDVRALEAALVEWAELCGINTTNTVLALDGKVLRGARTTSERAPNHVTLYDVETGTVLDQELVPTKTGETPIARCIFERNDLTGSLITADAAHTVPATTRSIKKKGAISSSSSKKINLGFSMP